MVQKKVIAIGGSNSKTSINKRLAAYAAELFQNVETETIDLNDFPMPLFSVDVEKEIGSPPAVDAFIKKINEADFLVLSLAENNGIYNVGFKNVFDWVSRKTPKVFQERPMLLMATSTGKRGGAGVLAFAEKHLPRYGADVKAVFSFPLFSQHFDKEKGITDEALKEKLLNIIRSLGF
jgi:chromate reductase, NAD(P)H dehydrogenase (quinone)